MGQSCQWRETSSLRNSSFRGLQLPEGLQGWAGDFAAPFAFVALPVSSGITLRSITEATALADIFARFVPTVADLR